MKRILSIKALVFSFSLFTNHFSTAQVWNNLGSGLNSGASALEMLVYKDTLYVTGGATAGGLNAGGMAKWDGANWDTLEHYQFTGIPGYPLATFKDSLAMALRLDYKSTAGYLSDIAISDGLVVKPLCNNCKISSGSNSVSAMLEYKNELYIGGNFVDVGGISAQRIARWNGTSWNTVGGGVTGGGMPKVYAMAIYDGELHVSGDIGKVGSVTVKGVARWDGTQWNPVGSGLNGVAGSLVVDTINNFLYAGGGFLTTADGIQVGGIAKWDGEKWDSVGTPLKGVASFGMTMYKNQLFIGGGGGPTWTAADTVMARWDGKEWYPVHGPNGGILSLATYKDELYVGGGFTKIFNDDMVGIARYKDTTTIKNCNYLQPRIFVSYNTADEWIVQFKNNNKYASWEWDFGDGTQAFEQNPEHNYTDRGTFNVTVTVTHDGCTATATKEVVVDFVGLKELEKANTFKVFPNPTSGVIELVSDEVIESVEVIDINGKLVYSEKLEAPIPFGTSPDRGRVKSEKLTLNLNNLSKGVYYIKATNSNGTVSQQKLIKN